MMQVAAGVFYLKGSKTQKFSIFILIGIILK